MFYFACLVILLLVFQRSAEGCSCFPMHPQEVFCSKNSDFVIKAVVLSGKHTQKSNLSVPDRQLYDQAYYDAYITKVFKGQEDLKSIFMAKNSNETFRPRRQKVILYTSATSGTCGVHLRNRTKYLLSGVIKNGQLHIGTCDWIVPFENLSRQQRAGIRGGYDCGCRLMRCPFGRFCERPQETCNWDAKYGGVGLRHIQCDMKHRTCKRIGHSCLWLEDQKYETCVINDLFRSSPILKRPK